MIPNLCKWSFAAVSLLAIVILSYYMNMPLDIKAIMAYVKGKSYANG